MSDPSKFSIRSLDEIRAFVAIVEQQSFSAAAKYLGISQPTISLRLQALESSLGFQLLHRRGQLTLTHAGREIYNRARALIVRAEGVSSAVEGLHNLNSGHLHIGFSTPFFLMKTVRKLRTAYPKVVVRYSFGDTSQLLKKLYDCEIDAGVMTLDKLEDGLTGHEIARQEPALCVPVSHAWAQQESISIEALEGQEVIVNAQTAMTRQLFLRSCEMHGVTPGEIITIPSREAIKEAVAANLGIGVILSKEVGSDRRLKALRFREEVLEGLVYAVALEESSELPTIKAFFNTYGQSG